MSVANLYALLEAGVKEHRTGNIDAAKLIYRTLLCIEPGEPNASHLLAVAEKQSGGLAAALRLMARALTLAPNLAGLSENLKNLIVEAIMHLQGAADRHDAAMLATLLPGADRLKGMDDRLRRQVDLTHFLHLKEEDAFSYLSALPSERADPFYAGLSAAALSIIERKAEFQYVGSIVIPAYNSESYISLALDSVVKSILYFLSKTGDKSSKFLIIVSDDGSRDGTCGVVAEWMRAHPEQHVTLLQQSVNKGTSIARNSGAKNAKGEFLWFLDSDDAFLEKHIYLSWKLLQDNPDAGFSRTGMYFDEIDEKVTQEWRAAAEHTYPCNLCIRLSCHDAVGGFPEEKPFRPGVEDVAYSRSIQSRFLCVKSKEKTVRYNMRTDNVLNAMKDVFQGKTESEKKSSPKDIATEFLIRRRMYQLSLEKAVGQNSPRVFYDNQRRIRAVD